MSQILRILDLKHSISYQIYEVLITTALALPSFLNPLLPLILLLSCLLFNNNLNSNNENKIINLYFDKKSKFITFFVTNLVIISLFIFNNEIIAPKLYEKYKKKELDVRNNLKLGIPEESEFHIGEELSIFFDSKSDNNFKKVEAILYKDNQFILAENAVIEYDKHGFNIVFLKGFRLLMNSNEKSKTIFEKFIFNIKIDNLEELTYDKEHYNTTQLLNNTDHKLINHGHNRIIHYLLIITLLINSNTIVFKNYNYNKIKNTFLFILIICFYLINSFLLYNLNQYLINISFYYSVNIISLIIISYIFKKLNDSY